MRLCRNSSDLGERWECGDEYFQCYKAGLTCTHQGGHTEEFFFRGCGKVAQIGHQTDHSLTRLNVYLKFP